MRGWKWRKEGKKKRSLSDAKRGENQCREKLLCEATVWRGLTFLKALQKYSIYNIIYVYVYISHKYKCISVWDTYMKQSYVYICIYTPSLMRVSLRYLKWVLIGYPRTRNRVKVNGNVITPLPVLLALLSSIYAFVSRYHNWICNLNCLLANSQLYNVL